MTLRMIDTRKLRDELRNLEACAEHAPAGTYEEAKAVAKLVSDTLDSLAVAMEGLGLKFNGADPAEEVAAVLYGFIKDSNPEAYGLITGEGFGDTMLNAPAETRDRVLAQAASNRDFLAGARGVDQGAPPA